MLTLKQLTAGTGDENGNSSEPAPRRRSSDSKSIVSQQSTSSQEPFCVRNAVLLAFIPTYCEPPPSS